ncbi:MAG: ABC transporter permease [Lentisphaeria bacterium]
MSQRNAAVEKEDPSLPKIQLTAVDSQGQQLIFLPGKKNWVKLSDASLSLETPTHASLFFSGFWLQDRPRPCLGKLFLPDEIAVLYVDCTGISSWDSSILIYLRNLEQCCQRRKIRWEPAGVPSGMQRLLTISASVSAPDLSELLPPLSGFIQKVGESTYELGQTLAQILSFVGEFTLSFARFCSGRARFQWRDVILQLSSAGPAALGIICLIGFLMGLILAFIGAIPLQWFGAESYIASLIGIGILRLLGPVMVGVVMAGRTGAAFAAELGAMQTNEEIDAFCTLGIPPMDFLVLPRCLALTVMMPFLCLFADLLGILGGLFVAVYYLNITYLDYYQTLLRTTRMADLLVGLFSGLVFGILVSACGCYQGIYCGRNAEAVGKAATDSVVNSIICIVLATAVITIVTVTIRL